jgi:hypothetical protein
MSRAVVTLPSFDTGRYEGSDFLMSGGDALLTIRVTEMPPFKISFFRVRWHQFTALYNCSVDQIESAYFAVVEVDDSQALAAYVKNDRAPLKTYRELHHYRTFLTKQGGMRSTPRAVSPSNPRLERTVTGQCGRAATALRYVALASRGTRLPRAAQSHC